MKRRFFLHLIPLIFGLAASPFAFANGEVENSNGLGDSTLAAKINPFESKIVNGNLQIRFLAGNGSGIVGMHDILGNKIFESSASEFVEFNMNGLKSGVYFIVWRENKTSFTRRFVFRREI